jgi:hypothetical protein
VLILINVSKTFLPLQYLLPLPSLPLYDKF